MVHSSLNTLCGLTHEICQANSSTTILMCTFAESTILEVIQDYLLQFSLSKFSGLCGDYVRLSTYALERFV